VGGRHGDRLPGRGRVAARAFSIDRDEGPGFGLIAGGVGIAGLISMVRTMADRNDVRPVLLLYGNGEWDDVAFRDDLERLEGRPGCGARRATSRPTSSRGICTTAIGAFSSSSADPIR
jgi:ferredoxin-NADP reductase